MCSQPTLTPTQQLRLFRRIERGDLLAKDRVIESNLRLVYSVAVRYRGLGVPFEDLVQEGTVGLVRAVEKFDHRRELKFSTYAVWWIRRAVLEALREAPTIRIPARAERQLAAIQRSEAELRRAPAAHGATTQAIAERTGLSAERVRTLRCAARVSASLDEQVGEDGTPLGDLVADPDAVDPWHVVDGSETCRHVRSMVRMLPPRHREVVVRRYGLAGASQQTHARIGAQLGVGEERSRQLESEALHWLRELGGRYARAASVS